MAGKMNITTTPKINFPSIFNDVIGPVMRGPSSSHCAAALRIGRIARDLMGGEIDEVLVEFYPTGSLAMTHESQGSDMGLFGGLLGWEATDPRLPEAARALDQSGVSVRIEIGEFGFEHPNTYRLTLMGDRNRHTMTALSTGGGSPSPNANAASSQLKRSQISSSSWKARQS